MRTGLIAMGAISLVMAVLVTWQLYAAEGLTAILWGLGFGLALWAIFALALGFNTWVRGRSRSDN